MTEKYGIRMFVLIRIVLVQCGHGIYFILKRLKRRTLTKPKDIDKPQYISTDDMELIEKRIMESSKQEARQEANKEVMNMMGVNLWFIGV